MGENNRIEPDNMPESPAEVAAMEEINDFVESSETDDCPAEKMCNEGTIDSVVNSEQEESPTEEVIVEGSEDLVATGKPEGSHAEAVVVRKYLYCWIPIVIVVLDRLTKFWAQTILKPKKSIPVIGDAVTFTYLENEGAAWGMLSGKVNLFVILTALLIVGILFIVARIPSKRRFLPLLVSFLCLIGGAFGNLYDRIFEGKVTDFISFDVIHFPVFNVADIFVTCSFFLLMIFVIFVYREEELSFIPLFGTERKK